MNKLVKFKAQKFEKGRIDFDKKIIYDVVLIEPNREASGHGMFVDQKMVNQVVELGNAGAKIGFKARFDHPNACANSTMGTQLGRLKNYRLNDNNKAIADLHIGGYTKHSPNGDIGKWLLTVADEDPDQIGFSIVFSPDESVTFEAGEDEDPDQPKFLYPHARIKAFHGADVVDEGAATSSLFSEGILGRPDYLAEQAEHFLNEKKDLFKTILKPLIKEMVTELNNNTNQNQSKMSDEKKSFFEKLTDLMSNESAEAGEDVNAEELSENSELEAATIALASKIKEVEALTTSLATEKEALTAVQNELTTAKEGFSASLSELKTEFEAFKSESIGNVVDDVADTDESVDLSDKAKEERTEKTKQSNVTEWISEGFSTNK
jgi:hypothetical protein